MPHPGDPRRHYRLVQGMARATGVDLAGAFDQGRLSPAQWAGLVEACRRCAWSADCGAWLRSRPSVASAPKTCRNRARLALLRLEEDLRT